MLVEGAIAFFRTGLVLLKLLTKDLKNIRDVSEFTMAFEKKVRSLTDIEKFRVRMQDLYINRDLMEVCRTNNIENKQNKFYESPNQRVRGFEKCQENAPYCHWERNAKFKVYQDYLIRVFSLSENIKFNFFDPFKNSVDANSYDYLKKGEYKQFLTEDRFTTVSSKRTTMNANGKGNLFNHNTSEFNEELEADIHKKYLEQIIENQGFKIDKKKPKKDQMNSEKDFSGMAGSDIIQATEIGINLPLKTKKSLGNSPSVIYVPYKRYFDNQSLPSVPQVQIAPVQQKLMERMLVIARSSHICQFERYEFINREINLKNKAKYFLIVNSILYNYLGENIKKENQQTLNVISIKPIGVESSLAQVTKRRADRRKFPRSSLDRWPKKLHRFSSTEGNRRRAVLGRGTNLGQNDEEARRLVDGLLSKNKRRSKMPAKTSLGDDSEIDPEEFKLKYRNAYILNEEGLKNDILKFSVSKSNIDMGSKDERS